MNEIKTVQYIKSVSYLTIYWLIYFITIEIFIYGNTLDTS